MKKKKELKKQKKALRYQTTYNSLTAYLNQLKNYPILSKEKEKELSIEYQKTKDPRIAEILITSNLRFVVKIALEYARFGVKLIDLIQEGNIGLIQAVKEFNPYKDTRLITYAVWWIRGYIQEYIMKQYSLVKIGTTKAQKKLFYKLEKETEKLKQLGEKPTVPLLSERLGTSEKDIKLMKKRLSSSDSSLDKQAYYIQDESAGSFDEKIDQYQKVEILKKHIDQIKKDLNEKEMYVLERRILAEHPLTLNEIGERFSVTREAIRQIENKVIEKIRSVYPKD